MSDVSQGDGWWEAKDGKWYPPERHPDYKAPTQVVAPVAPTPQPSPSSLESDGWWKASDGNWYAPERHPSYQPPNPTAASQQANSAGLRPLPAPPTSTAAGTNRPDGWWQASDGNWYPQNLHPSDRNRDGLGGFAQGPGTLNSAQHSSVANDRPGNGFSASGLICGVIAFFFLPPLFGILGIAFGAIGASRREPLGVAAIVVSVLGLVGGMFIGAVLFTNMM
ncbi:hypothetical protein IMCC26207_109663 [Actinobacteria bacterium IMCC26207]|nr:hypothetical protein IMCC26207_109663 [Actinobacteria bacterium IMCC26207]